MTGVGPAVLVDVLCSDRLGVEKGHRRRRHPGDHHPRGTIRRVRKTRRLYQEMGVCPSPFLFLFTQLTVIPTNQSTSFFFISPTRGRLTDKNNCGTQSSQAGSSPPSPSSHTPSHTPPEAHSSSTACPTSGPTTHAPSASGAPASSGGSAPAGSSNKVRVSPPPAVFLWQTVFWGADLGGGGD